MTSVRTVLGDVDPAELGTVDYHEHLFQVSPLLPGDELDDEERSGAEAADLHACFNPHARWAEAQALGCDAIFVAYVPGIIPRAACEQELIEEFAPRLNQP